MLDNSIREKSVPRDSAGKRKEEPRGFILNFDRTSGKTSNVKVTCYMVHSVSFSKRV